jgi:hypothetical protein
MHMRQTVVNMDDARKHNLAPVTIHVDASAAGMSVRLFPTSGIYIALDSPPGAPISIIIWDCTEAHAEIEAAIRAKLVPPWANGLQIGVVDHGEVLGERRSGMTYATGAGRTRTAWFGVLVKREHATVLVSIGVGGKDGAQASAADVLGNSMIRAALATLSIE